MYSLFNNKSFAIHVIISFSLIILQGYMPKIYISDNISISPDILLVYLTYLVLRFEIYYFEFFVNILKTIIPIEKILDFSIY